MYQAIDNRLREEDFQELMDAFYETITSAGRLSDSDDSEWSITKDGKPTVYTVNWSTIWNKPKNVGKKCIILQKNDKYAITEIEGFDPEGDEILSRIYRLEDLSGQAQHDIR